MQVADDADGDDAKRAAHPSEACMTQMRTILGVAPRRWVQPSTLDDAAACLREAGFAGERVSFFGAGTEMGLGYPPEGIDLLVETADLARVVEYAPADMTIAVEAGLRLDALQAILAPHRQRLALDPPAPEATIGGLIATNQSGPRRARYGSLRDLIVGVSLIRADGSRVRGGGKVVKNVAGFDLPKLAVGSLGTLGMIATATFRLHPLPERVVHVEIRGCSLEEVRRFAVELEREQFEPAAFVALDGGTPRSPGERAAIRSGERAAIGSGERAAIATGERFLIATREHATAAAEPTASIVLDVCFEGFAPGAEEQGARLVAAATAAGYEAALVADEGVRRLEALHRAARTGGDVRCKLTFPPASLLELEHTALRPLRSALGDCMLAIYPAAGVAYLAGNEADPGELAAAVAGAREFLAALGGTLVLTAASPAVRAACDIYGALPPSIELMHALKMRFDPQRRLNRGRFIGGL